MEHFDRVRKRRAEFIKVPNYLKMKVGDGGLSDEVLHKAQQLLEENIHDFGPLAELYLESLHRGIEAAKGFSSNEETENILAIMIYPAMQLKANGGMFRYGLVTQLAERLIAFLEILDEPDIEAVEIILAFYTSIRAVVHGKITGDGGQTGQELMSALMQACKRYLDTHPPRIDFV